MAAAHQGRCFGNSAGSKLLVLRSVLRELRDAFHRSGYNRAVVLKVRFRVIAL